MRRRFPTLALAASLAACATTPTAPVDALTRAQASFERIQLAAQVMLPLLPVERRARVQVLLDRIAFALATARATVDPAERDVAVGVIAGDLAALTRATR